VWLIRWWCGCIYWVLIGVCMLPCSAVDQWTILTTVTLVNTNYCAPWWWCDCNTETCRSCFNVNFDANFITVLSRQFTIVSVGEYIKRLNGSLWRNIKLNCVRQHSHFITQGNYKATCFDYRLVILRPILSIVSQDAMHTLGSHRVYNHGIHQIK